MTTNPSNVWVRQAHTVDVPIFHSLDSDDQDELFHWLMDAGHDPNDVEVVNFDEPGGYAAVQTVDIPASRKVSDIRRHHHRVELTEHPLPKFYRKKFPPGRGFLWEVPINLAGNNPFTSRPQEVTFTMSDTAVTAPAASLGTIEIHDSDPNFTGTFMPVDAQGLPTTPDTIPVWAVSDSTIVALDGTTPDGLVATFKPIGVGTTPVSVTTKDTNGVTVTATGSVTVSAGEAVSGTIEFQAGEAVVPVATIPTAPAAPAPDQTPVVNPPASVPVSATDSTSTGSAPASAPVTTAPAADTGTTTPAATPTTPATPAATPAPDTSTPATATPPAAS